jgi:hypothetical protein
MTDYINDPGFWRAKAAETRKLAAGALVADTQADMLEAAESFERMAALLERLQEAAAQRGAAKG